MPNGPVVRAPQLEGSKPRHLMNQIDREGLGPWILKYRQEHPNEGYRKISEAILKEFQIHISFRVIGFYLESFTDPVTGAFINLDIVDKLPNIATLRGKGMATSIQEVLAESEVGDVEVLEALTNQGLEWFKREELPIPLRLKVAKELRETIKLKMELAGVVKPSTGGNTTNNNLNISADEFTKLMTANPEAVSVLRDLLYMANKVNESPTIDVPLVVGNDECE